MELSSLFAQVAPKTMNLDTLNCKVVIEMSYCILDIALLQVLWGKKGWLDPTA